MPKLETYFGQSNDGRAIGVAGDHKALAIRIWEEPSRSDRTAFLDLPYDEAERLRDYLNEYLIRYWPQEEDTE